MDEETRKAINAGYYALALSIIEGTVPEDSLAVINGDARLVGYGEVRYNYLDVTN